MANNRRNQSVIVRFTPALLAMLLCLFFGGSGVGYVWQKNQIYQLGQRIKEREVRLETLQRQNKRLSNQVAFMTSQRELDAQVKKLNLGLALPAQEQILRLVELPPDAGLNKVPAQFVGTR